VFTGPLAAELRRTDPERSGDLEWARYNAPFYERRITVPLAAGALEPVSGERAILDLSIAGYVAAVLAVFGLLLLLGARLPVATAVALATALLPALNDHAILPLTDSWGLALEAAAFAAAVLVLRRGPRWLIAWVAAILLLSLTRDSAWIPLLAVAWLTLNRRSRPTVLLLVSGLAAMVPVLLLFSMPARELLAQMLNDAQPVADPTWGFIADRYPGALVDMVRADGGFVRDGAWLSAAYLAGGLVALFALGRRSAATDAGTLLKAGAVAGIAYVLTVPVFSAFRLELALVPMAAYGLALGAEWLASRVAVPVRPRLAPGRIERGSPL
jgi:hypothetical protein